MSADNGTYILETKGTEGSEYRIASFQNIEDIYGDWDDAASTWVPNQDMIRENFTASKVYTSLDEAWDAAAIYNDTLPVSEYGVNLLSDFSQKTFAELTETN
jgi:hypothetical protein